MANAKKQPSGNWKTLVYDYTDKDNKRHYESFTSDTKKESEYLAAEFSMNKKRMSKSRNFTLSEAIDKYIENSDGVLSPTTINGYKNIKKVAFKDILDVPLKKLSNEILKNSVNLESKRTANTRNFGNTISAKTVCNEYGLITAVINLYYPELNCKVTLPAKEKHIKELLPVEIIMDVVKGTDIELAVLLAMWLSFTISEVKGLTKSLSVKDGYITIKDVVVTIGGVELKKDKAKAYERIRKHRIPEYIQDLIDKTKTDVLVPSSSSSVYHKFQRLLDANNLPRMSFHDLRHMNASVMALLNIPTKYALDRGGWKTESVMKNVYSHTFSQEREDVDDMIDAYFNNKMQTNMQLGIKKTP